MPDSAEVALTQRAYTLRLKGAIPGDTSWRDALWATHEAVNKGAKVFGHWLLTLRGGLSHGLVDEPVKEKAGKTRPPTDDDRRDRRILLALSWLSVESAPADDDPRRRFLVAGEAMLTPDDRGLANRELSLREELRVILRKREVSDSEIGDPELEPENQPDTWLGHCGPSLAARIREDAVWVNRSAMFDQATAGWDNASARKDTHTLLSFILLDDFLTLPTPKKPKKETEDATDSDENEERQKAVKASSKGAGKRTRHAFSHLLGEGKPFGKPKRSLILWDNWHNYLKLHLKETGIPIVAVRSRGRKKNRESGPAPTELQREMFSKAASRVAQIITKQRQQEFDRLRRKEADADLRKMEADQSFNAALSALHTYCDEYRVMSEATREFLIHPRQVTGWDRVVRQWITITEADPERAREARVEAAKGVQESDEEKKFGDVNLFFRLAEDRFRKVWCPNGNPQSGDPTILDRFVKGMKARSDSERLKVAAFRHPDPYRNPIFCQFGVSRPSICFRRLKAFTDNPVGNDPRAVGMLLWHPGSNCAKLTLMHGVSSRLDREIGSACDQVQQNKEELHAVSRRGRLGAAAAGLVSAETPARVAGVFDLKKIMSRSTDDEPEDVSDEGNDNGKLKEPRWNGTLSANRRELEAIQKILDKGDIHKARYRREQLRWTLTVSMEMEGRGPWFRYVAAAQDQTPFMRTARKDKPKDKNDTTKGFVERKGDKRIETEGWPWQEFNKPLKDNKDSTALVEDTKAARGDKACLILSRLPGLRILSVDLGHRFAASCSVWETLPRSAMIKEIDGREIVIGGTGSHDLYCYKRHIDGHNKKERTTIYRRIGLDKLPDGSEYSAPWARLDRQFFVKLQGEKRRPRAASNKPDHGINETAIVTGLVKALGLLREDAEANAGRRVDELMRRAVRIATLGLKRHGRQAKIAYAFNPDCPGIPGIGGKVKKITGGEEEHVRFLTNGLMEWHALSVDADWDSSAARRLWNQHIKLLPGGFEIGEPTALDARAEWPSKSEEELRESLKLIAKNFANANPSATTSIFAAWKKLWDEAEGQSAIVPRVPEGQKGPTTTTVSAPATGWYAHLRLLTDWIMGWHLPSAQSNHWNRNVGGLSLTRIATMKSLYQLHKAFAMRPRPDELRGAPEKGETNAGVAQSILDAMETMREQRVKQIASRIVEAALGVGIERDRAWDEVKQKWRYLKRPRRLLYYVDDQGVEHGHPRFKACHAVVIENLRNYRPDELQTRRENRALMTWSAGKVRKYLEEACQLHGLHLREVIPNYTSRQCSRTGLPGVRCDDVPVPDFLDKPWWRRAITRAKERKENPTKDKPYDAEAQLLVALDKQWPDRAEVPESERTAYANRVKCAKPIRLIKKGGDLFVAAPPKSCQVNGHRPCPLCDAKRGLQADLNAAANIGLRALLDPDFSGKWWYVPCGEEDGVPRADKVRGSACFGEDPTKFGSLGNQSGRRSKEITNFWADPSANPLRNAADHGFWLASPGYWKCVCRRVSAVLSKANGLSESPQDIDPR